MVGGGTHFLINNPGGVPRLAPQFVSYGSETDTFYTLRPVDHVGGFARIAPRELVKDWVLASDRNIPGASGNEDIQFSRLCVQNNIPMYYLENALIVEHQESTLGQHARYGKDYFGERF